jgi:hypothetical protein
VDTEVLSEAAQATPAWLTASLQRAGALTQGEVAAVEARGEGSTHSQIAWLQLRYTPGSTGDRPERLALKLCANAAGLFGASEVEYYTRDYAGVPQAPLPRCFHAAHDPASGRYHLLLEDLRATHAICWDRVPDAAFAQALADALAALHGVHWGRTAPAADGEIDRYIENIRPGLQPLLDAAQLNAADTRLLQEVFDHHPALMRKRARVAEGQTRVHGDPNPGNVLAPREPGGRVLLIDRQPFGWSLTRWLGVSDLAYAIVHWWPTPQRRALERRALERYHARLQRAAYPLDTAWRDYRLCAVQSLYVAVAWCSEPQDVERMRWVWQAQLHKALQAVRDLDCAALWR